MSYYVYPSSVLADQAFVADDFRNYSNYCGAKLLHVTSLRHNKNVLESKRHLTRDSFMGSRSETIRLKVQPR